MTNDDKEARKLLRETWHTMNHGSTEAYLDFKRDHAQAIPRPIELPPRGYDFAQFDEAAEKITRAEIDTLWHTAFEDIRAEIADVPTLETRAHHLKQVIDALSDALSGKQRGNEEWDMVEDHRSIHTNGMTNPDS